MQHKYTPLPVLFLQEKEKKSTIESIKQFLHTYCGSSKLCRLTILVVLITIIALVAYGAVLGKITITSLSLSLYLSIYLYLFFSQIINYVHTFALCSHDHKPQLFMACESVRVRSSWHPI